MWSLGRKESNNYGTKSAFNSRREKRGKRERDGDMSIYIPYCSHTRIYMRKGQVIERSNASRDIIYIYIFVSFL
ncbi:hypothetical protein RchiOBHm_Chr6g0305651 [Rosa chinensis]|uniref:Uncharacterized protein n=1 Tax=Rosa chinensis TaxID=74649 RepID=A0A2P6PZV5_ROSCH|nr:hypothetical protein RchiOBHm_Chr6g0305651 [Rosa chinensis]